MKKTPQYVRALNSVYSSEDFGFYSTLTTASVVRITEFSDKINPDTRE